MGAKMSPQRNRAAKVSQELPSLGWVLEKLRREVRSYNSIHREGGKLTSPVPFATIQLLRQVIQNSKTEKQKLRTSIQDGLCQDLTGILMSIKMMSKKIEEGIYPDAEELKKISGQLHKILVEALDAVKRLSAGEVQDASLVKTLRGLAGRSGS